MVVGGRDRLVHALDPETGKVRWTFGTRGKVDSSPVIAADRVYVASASGEIFALGLESGEVMWSFDTGSPILASPSIAAGRLLIGTVDGQLYCFGTK
jgi:outer membrane protein assembly factor BamB